MPAVTVIQVFFLAGVLCRFIWASPSTDCSSKQRFMMSFLILPSQALKAMV